MIIINMIIIMIITNVSTAAEAPGLGLLDHYLLAEGAGQAIGIEPRHLVASRLDQAARSTDSVRSASSRCAPRSVSTRGARPSARTTSDHAFLTVAGAVANTAARAADFSESGRDRPSPSIPSSRALICRARYFE